MWFENAYTDIQIYLILVFNKIGFYLIIAITTILITIMKIMMIQNVIKSILATIMIIKVLVMIIKKKKLWLMLCSTYSSFFKTSFLSLWIIDVAVFKSVRLFLSLFQIDDLLNEMLFWPKLLCLRGISKAIFDLVLYIFL